jgi:segregation and condensation protein A
MSEEYRVELDIFAGPLDLLLYLIRRDELDIQDVSIAKVADQYLEYVRLLESLDPNTAGDFLVLAATLAEIKSRHLLPRPPIDDFEDDDDASSNLVRELLEYKRFKDAAAKLGSAAEERAKRYVRVPADLPQDEQAVELEDAQIWDLVSAFSRVMSSIGQTPSLHQVSYDDTPIELWAEELLAAVSSTGPTTFQEVFGGKRKRGEVVGLFLALLELVRRKLLTAQQDRNFGTIYLVRLEELPEEADDPDADLDPSAAGDSVSPRLVAPEDEPNPDPSTENDPT